MNREINEKLEALKGMLGQEELAEADEITPDKLPKDRKAFLKKIGLKADVAWDGIHGYIATGNMPTMHLPTLRLSKDFLKKLTGSKIFRWIEADKGRVSIGF